MDGAKRPRRSQQLRRTMVNLKGRKEAKKLNRQTIAMCDAANFPVDWSLETVGMEFRSNPILLPARGRRFTRDQLYDFSDSGRAMGWAKEEVLHNISLSELWRRGKSIANHFVTTNRDLISLTIR